MESNELEIVSNVIKNLLGEEKAEKDISLEELEKGLEILKKLNAAEDDTFSVHQSTYSPESQSPNPFAGAEEDPFGQAVQHHAPEISTENDDWTATVPPVEDARILELETELAMLKEENKANKKQVKKLEREALVYKEEAEAQRNLTEMTVSYLLHGRTGVQGNANETEQFLVNFSNKFFSSPTLLKKAMPGSFLLEGDNRKNMLLARESYGTLFVLALHLPVPDKFVEIFRLLTSFVFLNFVAAQRRHAQPYDFAGRLEVFLAEAFKLTDAEGKIHPAMVYCTLDKQSGQGEITGNTLPVYLLDNEGQLTQLGGHASQEIDEPESAFSLLVDKPQATEGKWQTTFTFRKGNKLFCPVSCQIPDKFDTWLAKHNGLEEAGYQQKLGEWAASNQTVSKLLLAGIQY